VASNQVPSIGRVVHYVAYGTPGGEYSAGAHRAAIITEVFLDSATPLTVGLCILNPTGIFFNRAPYDESLSPGSWHWPEYVPPAKEPA